MRGELRAPKHDKFIQRSPNYPSLSALHLQSLAGVLLVKYCVFLPSIGKNFECTSKSISCKASVFCEALKCFVEFYLHLLVIYK